MEVKKNGSLPIVLTCQNIAGFPRKTMIVGERRHKNRGKRKGRFQKVDFFHAEKGADKSLSSMYSLSSVAHWSATSGQSQPKFREKKLRLYFI